MLQVVLMLLIELSHHLEAPLFQLVIKSSKQQMIRHSCFLRVEEEILIRSNNVWESQHCSSRPAPHTETPCIPIIRDVDHQQQHQETKCGTRHIVYDIIRTFQSLHKLRSCPNNQKHSVWSHTLLEYFTFAISVNLNTQRNNLSSSF